jgi:hypothetical protein
VVLAYANQRRIRDIAEPMRFVTTFRNMGMELAAAGSSRSSAQI